MDKELMKKKSEFRKFVDAEIIPNAKKYDEDQKFTRELIEKLAEQGYLGATIPLKYGGTEMEMVALGVLNEEVGRGCSGVRSLLTVHGMVTLAIRKWGTEEQREKWLRCMGSGKKIGAFALSEENAGSDAKGILTSYREEEDCYVLNGTKKWITMGQIADVFLVFAQNEGMVTTFLVERETKGLTVEPIKDILGARASMLGYVSMNECRVPKDNLIGGIGNGLSYIGLTCLDYGRYSIACGCVGIGQAALEESVKYAKTRKQFSKKLIENQLIQKMVTEMAVNVQAARLLCNNAGVLKDLGDHNSIIETWKAKYFASNMLSKVTSDAVQIHGGNGIDKNYPVERYFRDAKINEIIEGSTQVHEMLISKSIAQLY